jgi:hypothetical protein
MWIGIVHAFLFLLRYAVIWCEIIIIFAQGPKVTITLSRHELLRYRLCVDAVKFNASI